MRKMLALSFVVGVAVFVLACGAGGPRESVPTDQVVEDSMTTTADVDESAAAQQPGTEAPVTVDVAAEGTEFDPPVEVVQIPAGAWYCDMGTVHYARMDEGDGACAICGMALVQKSAEPMAAEGSPAESDS